MELDHVMRTTFAAREFLEQEVADSTLYRILDRARFAPSGGNRQGWRVILVQDANKRQQLAQLMQPTVQKYLAQVFAGEVPFNTIKPSQVDAEAINNTSASMPLIDNLPAVPALLVICVDLSLVTAFDRDLERIAVVPGASVYPFVWNILLAARDEGLGGVLTTFLAESEPEARQILALPDEYAIAAMVPLGYPVKQLTRLKRHPVEAFTRIDSWAGTTFTAPQAMNAKD